ELPREPRAVVVADDGQHAFVSHVVGAKMSVVDLATPAHESRAIDLRVHKVQVGAPSAQGEKPRTGCQGFVLAKSSDPAGGKSSGVVGRVFARMVSVDRGEPESASSGYGSDSGPIATETGEVSVIDAAAERSMTRAVLAVQPSLEPRAPECLLPRAVAYHAGSLYVTCLGIDALLQLDARAVDPARAETRRWPVAAGPTGVAIDEVDAR